METLNPFELLDTGGILSLLMLVASVAAMERGCEHIEARDMLKAIYVVDLEHVSRFWDDWENFERLVSYETLANGVTTDYLHRTFYLVRVYVAANESGGAPLIHPSTQVGEIIASARQLAFGRGGPKANPTSPDFLFSICLHDSGLLSALVGSGLHRDKLEAAVRAI